MNSCGPEKGYLAYSKEITQYLMTGSSKRLGSGDKRLSEHLGGVYQNVNSQNVNSQNVDNQNVDLTCQKVNLTCQNDKFACQNADLSCQNVENLNKR